MYIIYTPARTAAEAGLGAIPASGSCILCSRTLIPSVVSSSSICDRTRCPGVINRAKETRWFVSSKTEAVDTPRERRPQLPKKTTRKMAFEGFHGGSSTWQRMNSDMTWLTSHRRSRDQENTECSITSRDTEAETREPFMFILTFDTYVRYPRERELVFGGHVRRSQENVIAGKKKKKKKKKKGKEKEKEKRKGEKRERASRAGAPFLPLRARSRIDGKRVRKQFPESSCLASETAFVARRPRHVRAPLLFSHSLFLLLKKLPRASTGVIQRCKSTLRRERILHSRRTSGRLEIRGSVSKRNGNSEKYLFFSSGETIFLAWLRRSQFRKPFICQARISPPPLSLSLSLFL